MKKLLLSMVLLVAGLCATAQENEPPPAKGLLLENPVMSAITGYQTKETLLDIASAEDVKRWQRVWKTEGNKASFTLKSNAVQFGPYRNNDQLGLVSPGIALPSLSTDRDRINLYLEESYELESHYDQGLIQVSKDNGKSWQTLSVRSGQSEPRTSVINLTDYAGKTVKVALRLVSDGSNQYEGWTLRRLSLKQEVLAGAHSLINKQVAGLEGFSSVTTGFQAQTNNVAASSTSALTGNLTNLDAQKYPRFIFANVSVSEGATPLGNLDKANFFVKETIQEVRRDSIGNVIDTIAVTKDVAKDEDFVVYSPQNDTIRKPVDIVFLMDNSASMGNEQAAVAANVESFVGDLDSRGFNYRLGLCRFGQGANSGKPIFHANAAWYNDSTFVDVWNSVNTLDGGAEPSWDALYYSAQEYTFASAAQKIFILITDEAITGNNDRYSEITDRQVVIDRLQDQGIKAYTLVSAGTVFEDDFGTIATATGGRSYNITANFNDILDDIGTEIANTYTIRYRPVTPTRFDGLVRDVEITVDYNSKSLQLYDNYIPGTAPTITRTNTTLALHDNAQLEGGGVTIEVVTTDRFAPFTNSVTLYYRNVADADQPYQSVVMTQDGSGTTESIWSTTISGNKVLRYGIEYYVRATDGESTTTAPEFIDREGYPWTFAVLPNLPPIITHNEIGTGKPGETIMITAEVSDNTNKIDKVWINIKKPQDLTYQQIELPVPGTDPVTSAVCSYNLENLPSGVTNYYFIAQDNFGVRTFSGSETQPYSIVTDVPWEFTATNITHTIALADFDRINRVFWKVDAKIGNDLIEIGDVIGIFYTDTECDADGNCTEVEKCGGYLSWTNGRGRIQLIAYGDDPTTPNEKEGFADGEAFRFKIFRKSDGSEYDCDHEFRPGSPDTSYKNRGRSEVDAIQGYQKQVVALKKGWNLWSTNVAPIDPTFDELLDPMKTSILEVRDANGNTYQPGSASNTLTTYRTGYGYEVLTNGPVELTVKGARLGPTKVTVNLSDQYEGTITGTPYAEKENVEAVFPMGDQRILFMDRYINDGTGYLTIESYSPTFSFNDWTDKNMEPGQGYYVYVDDFYTSSFDFTYPAATGPYNARLAQGADRKSSVNSIPQRIRSIDAYMHVVIPKEAWWQAPQGEQEVRVYNAQGKRVGQATVQTEGMVVTLDGTLVKPDESFSLRLYNPATKTETALDVQNWKTGTNAYTNHQAAVVGSIGTDVLTDASASFAVYPNPAEDKTTVQFSLEEGQEVSIAVYDMLGRALQTLSPQSYEAGSHRVELNTSRLESGYYLLKLSKGASFETQKIVIE